MRLRKAVCAGVLVLAGVAGCDSQQGPASTDVQPVQASAALPAPVQDEAGLEALDDDGLRARAERALREQRIHAPAGDSAVDYYLALRERSTDTASVAAALSELQPYVLIAVEQALARQDLAEAQRLLALLTRIDAKAPALPRLREGLRLAQQQADQAESATLAEAMRMPAHAETAKVSAPAKTSPLPPAPMPAVSKAAESTPASPTPPAPAAPIAQAPAVPAPSSARAMPRLISDAAPRYPLAARNRRIEGSVQIAFTIQPDGQVSDTRLLSAQPAGVFEEAALAAAARWRFEATGERVNTTRTLTFRLPRDPQS